MLFATKMSYQLFEHICQNKILVNILKDVKEIKMKDGSVIYMKDNQPVYKKGNTYRKKVKSSLTDHLIVEENYKQSDEDYMDKMLSMYDYQSTRGDDPYATTSYSDEDDKDIEEDLVEDEGKKMEEDLDEDEKMEGIRIPVNMIRETPEDFLPPTPITPKTPVMKGTKCDIDLPRMTIPPSRMNFPNAPMLRPRRMTDADDRKELARKMNTLPPRVYTSIARAVNFYSSKDRK